jgi:outer membrane murein-binding lipoprotein Lpp
MTSLEADLMAKENTIYNRMEALKEDQKAAHEKLDLKMDNLTTHMTQLSTNIAELTGYIKAKKEDSKKS